MRRIETSRKRSGPLTANLVLATGLLIILALVGPATAETHWQIDFQATNAPNQGILAGPITSHWDATGTGTNWNEYIMPLRNGTLAPAALGPTISNLLTSAGAASTVNFGMISGLVLGMNTGYEAVGIEDGIYSVCRDHIFWGGDTGTSNAIEVRYTNLIPGTYKLRFFTNAQHHIPHRGFRIDVDGQSVDFFPEACGTESVMGILSYKQACLSITVSNVTVEASGVLDIALTEHQQVSDPSLAGLILTLVAPTQTYDLTVNSGTGDGSYGQDTVVGIIADAPPAGQVFDIWTGDTGTVANVLFASTTVTILTSDITVTATYRTPSTTPHTLTVNNGTGDGMYEETTVVVIAADTPPAGQVFDAWTGDVAGIANVLAASTTLTMPVVDTTVTATFKTPPTPTNVALGQPVVASGQGAANPPSLAVDGNTSTYWVSALGHLNWIYVDLGETHDISRMVANWNLYNQSKAYEFQVSDDAAGWTTVFSDPDGATANEIRDVTLDPTVQGRYVRMYSTLSGAATWPIRFDEFEVWGVPIPTTYALTVNSGSGDGSYQAGMAVGIAADAPPAGQVFDTWTGDTGGIVDVLAATTILTMPAAAATVTATYQADDPDRDGDGMPNDWEVANGLDPDDDGSINPVEEGADGNKDGDPQTNYEEYLADTNADDALEFFYIVSQSVDSNGVITVSIPASAARSFTLYTSETPGTNGVWDVADGPTIGNGSVLDLQAANPSNSSTYFTWTSATLP